VRGSNHETHQSEDRLREPEELDCSQDWDREEIAERENRKAQDRGRE
jgi:hypothetical protein